MLASLTPENWQVSVTDENVSIIDYDQDDDLAGITAITATANRAYEIADEFRSRGVKVVLGKVTVRLEEDGITALGKGTDADIVTASAKAYLNGLNRLEYLKN